MGEGQEAPGFFGRGRAEALEASLRDHPGTVYVAVYVESPKPWENGEIRSQGMGKKRCVYWILGKGGFAGRAYKAAALPIELRQQGVYPSARKIGPCCPRFKGLQAQGSNLPGETFDPTEGPPEAQNTSFPARPCTMLKPGRPATCVARTAQGPGAECPPYSPGPSADPGIAARFGNRTFTDGSRE